MTRGLVQGLPLAIRGGVRRTVRRHINLVYSVAWRRLAIRTKPRKSRRRFLLFSPAKPEVCGRAHSSGWHQTAAHRRQFQRATWRRQHRNRRPTAFTEQSESDPSWHRLSPLLEEAASRLGTDERNAVVLRF
jgi:hypothetical protein